MSIYLSDYSITNSHGLIQKYPIFCIKNKHPGCSFPWVLPTHGLWNKIGFSGYTIDADGIRLGTAAYFHSALPQAFLFYSLPHLDDPDMEELSNRVIGKLRNMTDEEFEQLELIEAE